MKHQLNSKSTKPISPKIGLALGSGGWRGLAHIGVIKSLYNHGYKVSAIAGSSAGALIGGLFCLWQDVNRLESEFSKLTFQDVLLALSDPSINLGFVSGNKTLKLFNKYFLNTKIEDLTIPFKAVASDILSGQSYVFDSGDLSLAVRASSSLPILFEPIKYQDHLLVDGGITNPIPVDIVRSMNVDIVIAVNIYDCIFPIDKQLSKISKLDLASLSTQLLLYSLSQQNCLSADVTVNPQLDHPESELLLKFINNQQAIDQGELAMDKHISKLKTLISSPL